MTTANVFVKVGTTLARVKPEHRERIEAELVKASKVRTPKQHQAARMAVKCSRNYPKFKDGMSTADYVLAYEGQNTLRSLSGSYTSGASFFQPLSTAPQFALPGEVIEEVVA